MGAEAHILWRRLDRPGHDACRLWSEGALWRLEGMAVWMSDHGPAQLGYEISVHQSWITHSTRVMGRMGRQPVSLSIHRDDAGNWRVNGEALPEMTGLPDIDLGFTPATNLMPIRRLRASRTEAADICAVWLDSEDGQLKRLPQHYAVLPGGHWRYRSPSHEYQADLTVDGDGFVTLYPDLWSKEG